MRRKRSTTPVAFEWMPEMTVSRRVRYSGIMAIFEDGGHSKGQVLSVLRTGFPHNRLGVLPLRMNNPRISGELTQSPVVLVNTVKVSKVNFPRSHLVNPFHPQLGRDSPDRKSRKVKQLYSTDNLVNLVLNRLVRTLHPATLLCDR